VAIRGEEVPMMDLKGAKALFEMGTNHPDESLRLVVIPLMEREKYETGDMYHRILVVLEITLWFKPSTCMAEMAD